MPHNVFHKVYLHDNYPSDISACMTIREAIWNTVSTIEAKNAVETVDIVHYSNIDDSIREVDDDLPVSFGKQQQPPLKKLKRRRKGDVRGMDQKFMQFSETKSSHNLYMGYNQTDGWWYPCRVLGVGPHSSPVKQFSVVVFIGYGTVAELDRSISLRRIPAERVNEINEYVMLETLHKAMGGVEHTKKYYDQRFRLFSRFDQGVQLDCESWFSITPEVISRDIADKCRAQAKKRGVRLGVVLDLFSGVGGNVIALAARANCQLVCAVDIDATKLNMLRCNAKVYGVSDKVECVNDDAYNILATLAQRKHKSRDGVSPESGQGGHLPDVLVLAPPWGGIDYASTKSAFDLRAMISSGDGVALFHTAVSVCPNIVYILPKHTKKKDLVDLAARSGLFVRVEEVHIHNKLKMMIAYYGPLFAL